MSLDPSPLLGTGLHTIGAASAALCYAPQRWVRDWSWQTYWLTQAFFCWLILPWIFAWASVPELGAVLAEAPRAAMLKSYALGALYGVGGIAFGVAIRYLGFSLTYAIAIGLSCVLGTLLPPMLDGTLGTTLDSAAGGLVVGGVVLGAAAIFATGFAGLRRERETKGSADKITFDARRGLPLVAIAGVLSAVFNFSLQAAAPVAAVAAAHGAGVFQSNVIYLFSNSGAFTTTLCYASWLATRNRTWAEFAAPRTPLLRNYALSSLTGLLWYLQFFFYGLGHVRMGALEFSSWAIHMIILILLSCGFGLAIGEWRRCSRRTQVMVSLAVVLLLGAVGLIAYGNKIAANLTT